MNTKKKGLTSFLSTLHGGDGGIRTHVPISRQNDFEFSRRLLITWFLLSDSVSLVRPQTRMKSGLFEKNARKY